MANPELQTRTNDAGAVAHYYEVDGRKVDVADEDIARIEGINNDALKLTFLRGYEHPENVDPNDPNLTNRENIQGSGPDAGKQQGSS